MDSVTESRREETLGHKAIHHVNSIMEKKPSKLEHKLDKTMMELLIANVQVAEVYSPPRVVAMAKAMGLKGGWSLDLTTTDCDGRRWNFNELEMRNRAVRRVIEDQPLFLIGSPMCIVFSAMNRINHSKMRPEEVEARMACGRAHLEFAPSYTPCSGKLGGTFSTNTQQKLLHGKKNVSEAYRISKE